LSLDIRLATSAALRDAAYELRFRVFSEEKYEFGAASIHNGRFVDYWDTFNTTYLYVLLVDGKVVTTLRCVGESDVGLPARPYDFEPHRAALGVGAKTCLMGRLATDPAHRGSGLGVLLQEMAISHQRAVGYTHIFGLANTRYTSWWEKIGYEWLGPAIHGPGTAIDLRPHMLPLQPLPRHLAARDFCARARLLAREARWMRFQAGETIGGSGDVSPDRSFCHEILYGEVSSQTSEGPAEDLLAVAGPALGVGAVVGDLLGGPEWPGCPRKLVVASGEVVTACIDRPRFNDLLRDEREWAEEFNATLMAQCATTGHQAVRRSEELS
jgi:GNAT superfamily N-acetyltransferase